MDTTRSSIAVLPLGNIPAEELVWVEEVIRSRFGMDTMLLPGVHIPAVCYDPARQQYDADRLLDLLFDRLPNGATRILGVLSDDMFAAGRTFVFGYAHLRDGVAIYSMARLREEWYERRNNTEKQQTRSLRCIVHELGHTFGNPHCEESECVMHAVSQVDSLDRLGANYCESCHRRVRSASRIAATSAEGLFNRASALLRRHHLPQAIAAYRCATEKAPHQPRYFNDLGVALLASADRDGARAAFHRATELRADFPHPYYNLGILCRENGGAEAEHFFTEGLRRDPDKLAGNRYIARLYEELFRDFHRACKHYRTYIELGGNDPDVVAHLEWLYVANKSAAQG